VLPHAWFVGFTPADNSRVSIAFIVENSRAGVDIAAPIARQLIAVNIGSIEVNN